MWEGYKPENRPRARWSKAGGCEEKDRGREVLALGAQGETEGQSYETGQEGETADEKIVVRVVSVGVAYVAGSFVSTEEIDYGGVVGVRRAEGRAGAVAPGAGGV
jgi:hypothetical protein